MLIYIEPYVYTNIVRDQILYFNTLSKDVTVVKINAFNLKKLPNNSNRLVGTNETDFLELKLIIEELRDKFMIDYIDEKKCEKYPFITAPKINFSTGVNFQDFILNRTIQDSISQVNEISLFINDLCKEECDICQKAFKQFNCCTRGNTNRILEIEKIKEIFNQLKNAPLLNVNILGGNVFLHPQISDILNYLNTIKLPYSIFVHYKNLDYLYPLISKINGNINILISNDTDKGILNKLIKYYNTKKINLNFIIESEVEYNYAQKLCKEINKELTYRPFYNGNNMGFFEKNVFLDESDFKCQNIEYKDILINEIINKNHYGQIIIDSNGNVRGGVNDKAIGNIYKTSLGKMIFEKFEDIESWFIKRNEVEKCKQCIYNMICPPISNYEKALKRNNLCNIFDR